ncbi:diacylglycerol/lipid kinase family protein [Enterococcus villorum]|uniref:diacylglycerol/lipid kinase family protein n=1 Tax=Enterococcus villorum TaxID=112904 RepID=UPI003F8AC102
MNFHYYLLVNQAAGSGTGKKVAEKIIPLLEQKKLTYSIYYSEYKGHDAQIAEELAKKTLIAWTEEVQEQDNIFPLLVVIGGDGTLHQVLNTFYHLGVDFPVAYIPAGSGNDFARGIGLDAAIVHATNHSNAKKQLNKYHLGSFSYLLSILRVFFCQKGFPILVDIGGKQIAFDKAFLCTATNHPYFGGGVAIAPTAEIAKSTIDLVVVERINLFKILWIVLLLLQKKQMKSKNFHHFTTSKLRILSTVPQYGQEDGEDMEKQPFDLQLSTKKQLFWCEVLR